MIEKIKDFFFGETVSKSDYLYKTPHLITLAVVVVTTIILIATFAKKSKKAKDAVLWTIFAILLFLEIAARVVGLINGRDAVTTLIPMHFCSIMVWVIIIAIAFKNRHLLNIAAAGGLIATLSFLVHPAVGFNVEVLKFSQYYSVISHSLGFVLTMFLIFSGYVSYKFKEIWIMILFLIVVFIYSLLLNFVFYPGSNYMYYVENLTNLPDYLFQMFFAIIVIVYMLSFYVMDVIITNKRNKKKLNK